MSPKTDENSTGTLYNADNLCSYTVFCKRKKNYKKKIKLLNHNDVRYSI